MTWIIMLEGPLPWIGFLFCEYFFKFLHWAYGDFVLELCTDIYTLLGMIFGPKKKRKKSKKKKVPLQKPKYKIEPDTHGDTGIMSGKLILRSSHICISIFKIWL
jgi:hypothetical protein